MTIEAKSVKTGAYDQLIHREPEHLRATKDVYLAANPQPKDLNSPEGVLWQEGYRDLLGRVGASIEEGTFLQKTPEELAFGPQELNPAK